MTQNEEKQKSCEPNDRSQKFNVNYQYKKKKTIKDNQTTIKGNLENRPAAVGGWQVGGRCWVAWGGVGLSKKEKKKRKTSWTGKQCGDHLGDCGGERWRMVWEW